MELDRLDHAKQALAAGRLEEGLRLLKEVELIVEGAIAARKPQSNSGPINPDVFTLHVDGVGSFRVFHASRVKFGPIGAADVDAALQADESTPTATIERLEEDYFLQAASPVKVNDELATSRLLSDGDRISLTGRVRLTLRRPTAASTTAVVALSGTRLPKGDVRAVILMEREILIGPGGGTHIRSDDLEEQAVLLWRNGELELHSPMELKVDSAPAGGPVRLREGQHVQLGALGLVMTCD